MTQTATLENVINKVHRVSMNHYDETVPVGDMNFESLDKMEISGQKVQVEQSAQRLLSNRLKVPYSYLSRCPADLQAENLNFWIEREAQNRDTFFCRFNGEALRAVFTERYKPLDNMEVLSELIQSGFDTRAKVQYSLDEKMFLLKIPEYARTFNVNPDYGKLDEIVPGLSFANSEVGIMAFSIESYFYRLICTNGLISQVTSAISRFKHISNKGLESFGDTLSMVIEDSMAKQEKFMTARNSLIEDPVDVIDTYAKRLGLSQDEVKIVKENFWAEPGETLFHILNAFTAAARTRGLSTTEIYKLESAGGEILSRVNA